LGKRRDVPCEISIGLHSDGSKFLLTVSDNGVGIPADLQIEECKSLGLKLVSVLVRQLKGTLHLDRSRGTKFIIEFNELKRIRG